MDKLIVVVFALVLSSDVFAVPPVHSVKPNWVEIDTTTENQVFLDTSKLYIEDGFMGYAVRIVFPKPFTLTPQNVQVKETLSKIEVNCTTHEARGARLSSFTVDGKEIEMDHDWTVIGAPPATETSEEIGHRVCSHTYTT